MIEDLQDKLVDGSYNFTNTARTVDKLLQNQAGTAIGLTGALIGKNPVTSTLLGAMVKPLSKDAPDALRLSLLKFLGSKQPITPSSFKTSVELIHSVIKANKIAMESIGEIFKPSTKAISNALIPKVTQEYRNQLDKEAKAIEESPLKLQESGKPHAAYMPEHGEAIAQTASRVANYLNSIRPKKISVGILDKEIPISVTEQAKYDRALTIAQQPLTVLQKIKTGTLLPDDIMHFQSMYPDGYKFLQKKITEQLTSHLAEGRTLPAHVKKSLSDFLQEPLDASQKQPYMQAIMAANAPKAMPAMANKPTKISASTAKTMQRTNQLAALPAQARAASKVLKA
jgi:hypothetical protein